MRGKEHALIVRRQLANILWTTNQTRLGEDIIVRVPEIAGRIVRVNKKDALYVQLIYKAWKDPATGQNRNRKTIVGKVVEICPEAMYPNKRYEDFFDMKTGELKKPLDDTSQNQARDDESDDEITDERIEEAIAEALREADEMWKEEKKSRLEQAQQEEKEKLRAELDDGDEYDDPSLKEAEALIDKMVEEIRQEEAAKNGTKTLKPMVTDEEEETDDEGRAIEEDTDEAKMNEAYAAFSNEKERLAILKLILRGIHDSNRLQARKRPDDLINPYKVDDLNSLLAEVKEYYSGTGYEDLLKLIEEPREEERANGHVYITGPTYSDVDVLLSHYDTILKFIDVDKKNG